MPNLLQQFKLKFSEAKAVNSEVEQALIRVSFVSFITLYLLFNHSHYEPVALCLFYLCCGFLMLFNILRNPQKNEKRQWTAMVMDITATSLEQMISASLAGVFIGVYLWLIIGYGLRYGVKFFKGCYVMSLFGFGLTLYLNPYWNQHTHLAYGFIVTMLLIPPHTLRLLVRLEKATKDANLANEAKTNFLSNISHEMRTPLNGIIGASELLEKTELDKKQNEFLGMLSTSATALRKLINDVLDISKIEKGKIELEQVTFYLPDVTFRLNQMFNIERERKQLWMRFHVDKSVERYYVGSLQHLEQILMNLVSNAVKFTQHGGIDIVITPVHTYANFSKLSIKIQDTGIGIKPDMVAHIFESFTQADSTITRRYGGTGLGTTIAKELSKLMGGDITVSSNEATGTAFEVLIPLNHATSAQIEAAKANHITDTSNVIQLSKYSKLGKKIRVLVADDNIVNRLILNETLNSMDCVVKSVDNGEEVLDILEKHQFDLMILDFNMPEMNGLEAFRIYHTLPGSKPIRTVILTADATKATQDMCLAAGIYQVLTKPVISKQIQSLIDEVATIIEATGFDPDRNINATPDIGPIKTIANQPKEPRQVAMMHSDEPLVDSLRIAHLRGLNPNKSFILTLISQFISSNDDLIELLGHECLNLNLETVHKLAHQLAGESANMGLMPLSNLSRQLMGLTMADAKNITDIYSAVLDVYKRSCTQLNDIKTKSS
ncbi:MAG: ATP-binding protein [Methylophilus sp.]|uniref:ATP-binding protein n=1 Tax=Methylophilus sp. TaxID=29541 RepID=UPI003FA086BD